MRLPSLDEGQTRFKPYHSGFREAARIAHGRWINKVRPEYAQCSLRVVRNNVTPLFAQEARTLLGGLNGIRFIDTRNKQTLTVFSPRAVGERPWVARYKHVDSNFRAHNIPTKATMRFDAQEDLADVPSGSIYFTLAYQMAGPDSELVGPFIILALHDKIFWRYNIDNPEDHLEATYLYNGGAPLLPTRRVRPARGLTPKKKRDTPER